ncbi:outer membrane protein transport protein [Aliivibrio wodanis]|uniref:outer membrane protein transport protein n=1 Tax=Aliivibrio wodanis TaxID=80852 RepID=UPI00406C16AC
MTMTKMRNITKLAFAVSTSLLAANVTAAGFQLNAQSATGIGRAFAGDAVIADNASVMARNAAAMALFDETSFSLGFETITTDIEVKDAKYCGSLNGCNESNIRPGDNYQESNYDNAGGTSLAPNLHLIVPLNEKFAVGANIYSNFGTSTEFDDSFVGREFGGMTDVMSINFGLAGSYRLNDQWSFGAGLDLVYGKGEMERTLSDRLSGINDTVSLLPTDTAIKAEADGWGLGFNLGTVFELNENNRFGLAYHYSPEIKAEGDVEFLGNSDLSELTLPLPEMIEFSGYHRIEDTKFAVHYSVQYIGWGVFDKITTNGDETIRDYKWQDGMHYSIGGTYYLNSDWTLRAGYMYDTSAQDELTSVSVPDSDRQWFSTGFTYHITKKSNIDFGFTYLMGEDVDVSESYEVGGVTLSTMEATTRANAILMGLQYSHSF